MKIVVDILTFRLPSGHLTFGFAHPLNIISMCSMFLHPKNGKQFFVPSLFFNFNDRLNLRTLCKLIVSFRVFHFGCFRSVVFLYFLKKIYMKICVDQKNNYVNQLWETLFFGRPTCLAVCMASSIHHVVFFMYTLILEDISSHWVSSN